jgi:CRISPR-associated protein Cas2
MVVIVLTACPVGLRGDLTRWLLEISPGVFVGHLDARVREKLWERIVELSKNGRAIMVYSARNEQHLAFKVHGAEWSPTDCEGLELVNVLLVQRKCRLVVLFTVDGVMPVSIGRRRSIQTK